MPPATDDSPPAASDARERILEAARRRFAAHGLDGVTMREIAGDSGLTMPTVYHYFGDKQGLYEACVASVVDAAALSLREAFRRGRTPAARANAFASTLCGLLLGNARLLAFLQHERLEGSTLLATLAPAELLAELDTALGGSAALHAGSMTPARRLLAYALGIAIVRRSGATGDAERLHPAKLARLLLAACRATARPSR